MIKQEVTVTEARCDACSASLIFKDTPSGNVNYAILKHSFGYGSLLDDMPGPTYDLCEVCYRKAMRALGLWKPYVHDFHGGVEPKLP